MSEVIKEANRKGDDLREVVVIGADPLAKQLPGGLAQESTWCWPTYTRRTLMQRPK